MSCYYPNGNPSSGDIPCSSSGDGPCCPLNWSCESNGLCYLANAGYYGRYTCTDQTWDSPNCPQICTYGMYPRSFQHHKANPLNVLQTRPLLAMKPSFNAVRAAIAAIPTDPTLAVATRPRADSPWLHYLLSQAVVLA